MTRRNPVSENYSWIISKEGPCVYLVLSWKPPNTSRCLLLRTIRWPLRPDGPPGALEENQSSIKARQNAKQQLIISCIYLKWMWFRKSFNLKKRQPLSHIQLPKCTWVTIATDDRCYFCGSSPSLHVLDVFPRVRSQVQHPEVLVVVELLAVWRSKLSTEHPELASALRDHHRLMGGKQQSRENQFGCFRPGERCPLLAEMSELSFLDPFFLSWFLAYWY